MAARSRRRDDEEFYKLLNEGNDIILEEESLKIVGDLPQGVYEVERLIEKGLYCLLCIIIIIKLNLLINRIV